MGQYGLRWVITIREGVIDENLRASIKGNCERFSLWNGRGQRAGGNERMTHLCVSCVEAKGVPAARGDAQNCQEKSKKEKSGHVLGLLNGGLFKLMIIKSGKCGCLLG